MHVTAHVHVRRARIISYCLVMPAGLSTHLPELSVYIRVSTCRIFFKVAGMCKGGRCVIHDTLVASPRVS